MRNFQRFYLVQGFSDGKDEEKEKVEGSNCCELLFPSPHPNLDEQNARVPKKKDLLVHFILFQYCGSYFHFPM